MNAMRLYEDLNARFKMKDESVDKKISSIICDHRLNKNNHDFYVKSANFQKNNFNAAFNIAYNWREITKAFLFTTISGLGRLAEKIGIETHPSQPLLSAIQTSFQIISDDLGNNNVLFQGAPRGPRSIHYKWWEDTILTPLSKYIGNEHASLTEGTLCLIAKMKEINTNYLGVAVQLRIVEAIAEDICLAFLAIFSKVEFQGKKIFASAKDLTWIHSHIKAETIHHEQVSNEYAGVMKIAESLEEKNTILSLTHEYAKAWSEALNHLADFL